MKVGRSIGVILSLLIVMLFTNKYIDGKSYSRDANNNGETNIAYNLPDQILNNSSTNKEETITYKNEYSYPIYLNQSSISVKCTGYGENKEDDEELVKNNLQIKTLFSKDKNSKSENIKLEKNETVYIYVISNYTKSIYPTKEVTCSYNINIKTSI